MRNYFCRFLALALFAVALSGAVLAQGITYAVRANIPFDFYAGSKLMPAGEYTISINKADQLITIGEKATGNSSFLSGLLDDNTRQSRSVLVFQRAGDTYALRELKSPEANMSFHVEAPQLRMARQSQKGESVTVNAEGQ
jgi:hypothetical protein